MGLCDLPFGVEMGDFYLRKLQLADQAALVALPGKV
jgi:hypothetical protein